MTKGILQSDGTYCYTINCKRHTGVNNQPFDISLDNIEIPILAGQPIKTISFPTLYHVGMLDVSLKKEASYEGNGLSVSLHPDDWRKIARLNGDIHTFMKPSNRFLNYHDLKDSQKAALNAWGVEQGYLVPKKVYTVSRWDDEWEQEMVMTFNSREEAEEELWDEDDEITEVNSYVTTSKFPDETLKAGNPHYTDILATVWVREVTNLDGVWWEDDYDPSRLSAPRGVIVNRELTGWKIS